MAVLLNKKIYVGVFALALFCIAGSAHAAALSKPGNNLGLVTYWSFDDATGTVVTDFSGNKNNGTLSGSPLPTWVAGKHATALQFTSANTDYVQKVSPTNFHTGTSARSMGAWIKITTSGSIMVPFVYGSCSPNGAVFGVYVDTSNDLNFWGCGDDFDANYTLKTGVWYYVVITTVNGTTVTVYVNGVAVKTAAPSNFALKDPSGSTYLSAGSAKNIDPSNYYFNGVVDDLRYYNRTLSATEISALYGTHSVTLLGAPLNQTNPLSGSLTASWSFDNSTVSGTTVADQSGNGHNLTLENGASIATGYDGQALSLDGTNQYAVGFIGNLPTSVSLSMWVKANDVSTEQSVLVEQDSTTPNSGYHFTLVGIKDGAFYAGFWDIGDIASTPITAGTWYHVILTYDGVANTQSLYVDNVLQGTQNGTWSPPSQIYFLPGLRQQSCSFTNASGHCSDDAHYFNGEIDDLQGYDQAFSANDVNSLSGGSVTTVNVSSFALSDASTLNNGLVGLWSFDGKDTNWATGQETDGSGSGNTGQLISMSTTTTPTFGIFGQGFKFNGSDYVAVPYSVSIAPSQVSVSYWMKENAAPAADTTLVSRKCDCVGVPYYSDMRGASNQHPTFGTWTGGTDHTVISSTALSVGNWYHIVGTFDGSAYRIYINGALDNTLVDSTAFYGGTNLGLTIGAFNSAGSVTRYFNGVIDDVRIYNRALSAAEIKQLYVMGE